MQVGGEQRTGAASPESNCFTLEVPGEEEAGEHVKARKSEGNLHKTLKKVACCLGLRQELGLGVRLYFHKTV